MKRSEFLKRSFSRLGVLLLVVPMLAACGGDASTPTAIVAPTATTAAAQPTDTAVMMAEPTDTAMAAEPTNTAEVAAAPTDTPGPVTLGTGATKIRWWHISTAPDQRANWQDLANKYVTEHPNVSIEITVLENEAFKSKLVTSMQSGDPPDLFQSWGGGVLKQYADAGLVQDLTSALAGGWGDTFQPAPLGLYKVGDKNYGVPWEAGMVGFWYNKSLFEKAKIDTPPATWTELLDDVKKLKDAGVTPIALAGRDEWPGAFWWEYLATRVGGSEAFSKAYDRTGSFSDPAFVQAGTLLKQLVDLEPFQTGFLGATYPDQQAIMANGKAAMELMGQWAPGADRAVATDVKSYNDNLGFFPFPSVDGGAGKPTDVLGGADGFAIGKNAPAETIDFVKYLTSVETQSAMAAANTAVLPVVKGAENSLTDPIMKDVSARVGAAEYYQLYYDQYMSPAVGQVVNDQTAAIFAASSDADTVAKAVDEAVANDK